MNIRASIAGTGSTLLAFAAFTAQPAAAAGTLGCSVPTNHVTAQKALFAAGAARALQFVVIGDGAASTQVLRSTCGVRSAQPAPAPRPWTSNRAQVQRDAI